MAAGEQVSEQSGGFALSEKKEKNKSGVTKLSEVDDWRAMRDAAAQEAAEDAEVKVETEAKAEVDESAANESIGTSGLVLEEDGSLNMFWIDAYEDSAKPGRIYMFGKVRTGVLQTLRSTLALRGAKVLQKSAGEGKGSSAFSSCCLQIDNVQRQVFILPREKILDAEVRYAGTLISVLTSFFGRFRR